MNKARFYAVCPKNWSTFVFVAFGLTYLLVPENIRFVWTAVVGHSYQLSYSKSKYLCKNMPSVGMILISIVVFFMLKKYLIFFYLICFDFVRLRDCCDCFWAKFQQFKKAWKHSICNRFTLEMGKTVLRLHTDYPDWIHFRKAVHNQRNSSNFHWANSIETKERQKKPISGNGNAKKKSNEFKWEFTKVTWTHTWNILIEPMMNIACLVCVKAKCSASNW